MIQFTNDCSARNLAVLLNDLVKWFGEMKKTNNIKWTARLNSSQNGEGTNTPNGIAAKLNCLTVLLSWNSNDVKSRTFNSWFILRNTLIYVGIKKDFVKGFLHINPVEWK